MEIFELLWTFDSLCDLLQFTDGIEKMITPKDLLIPHILNYLIEERIVGCDDDSGGLVGDVEKVLADLSDAMRLVVTKLQKGDTEGSKPVFLSET